MPNLIVDNQSTEEKSRIIMIRVINLTSDSRASNYENDLLGLSIVNKGPKVWLPTKPVELQRGPVSPELSLQQAVLMREMEIAKDDRGFIELPFLADGLKLARCGNRTFI